MKLIMAVLSVANITVLLPTAYGLTYFSPAAGMTGLTVIPVSKIIGMLVVFRGKGFQVAGPAGIHRSSSNVVRSNISGVNWNLIAICRVMTVIAIVP
jgi:hypothetical protein